MYIQRLFEKKGGGLTTWIILKEQNLVCYLEFLTKTRLEKKIIGMEFKLWWIFVRVCELYRYNL